MVSPAVGKLSELRTIPTSHNHMLFGSIVSIPRTLTTFTPFFDNGAGRKKGGPTLYPLRRYLEIFPEAKKMVHKFFHERSDEDDDCPIDKQSSTALWAVMASQQMKSSSEEKKMIFY